MSFIEEVRSEREDLARVLKKHLGIRKIVEELYPDNAHFIYELLQNAEDTGATEAQFVLSTDRLAFEHNGRPFASDDIYGITDIGEGTKADDNDKIGRFGVGFKAVFAYSETPHIWSPTFAFKISDLVLPTEIAERKGLGSNTRFEFPFNNPKKSRAAAHEEIKSGLAFLPESALLFLGNIESITWRVDECHPRKISRVRHSDCHIELIREVDGKLTSTHFLQFRKPVESLPKQYVAIAFELDFLPRVSAFRTNRALSRQFRITPANPGRVSVFFPAEKETSGLRFHLHAPFVPELSRASIKETPANLPLYAQLAELSATSLYQIRDLGLLTGEFLAVLPNQKDAIPPRYQVILTAIVNEMNDQPLTPTHTRSHAPAKRLLQAKASLKDLFSSPDDVRWLNDEALNFDGWAFGASQKNSDQDRFLSELAIRKWDADEFVCFFERMMNEYDEAEDSSESTDLYREWITKKSDEWHQELYAFLYREASSAHKEMTWYFLIRCSDGKYRTSNNCYFSSDGDEDENDFCFVKKETYTSGHNKGQQEDARKFLEALGLHPINENDRIKAILSRWNAVARNDAPLGLEDIERFAKFVQKNPKENIRLFCVERLFKCNDGKWRHGHEVFLDSPFIETGLRHYYKPTVKTPARWALSDSYLQDIMFEKPGYLEMFVEFAQRLGAQAELQIDKVRCWENPLKNDLVNGAPGGWSENYGINDDYMIKGLKEMLAQKDVDVSMLIWRTVCNAKNHDWMSAKFRNNSQHPIRSAPSQLFARLRDCPWVPQKDGSFVLPSKAVREHLPEGFPFDEGYEWIKKIKFGSRCGEKPAHSITRNGADISKARELGFENKQDLDDGQWFARLDPSERQRIKEEQEHKRKSELPEYTSRNPQLRAERVGQQAIDSPERKSELRTRSISIGRDDVKKEAAQYLQQQYTNNDGEMICQICQDTLPFKLADDSYYFEKVELLPGLKNRHYQNYLALCPNHAAMYQHANGSADKICDAISELAENTLQIVLAATDCAIYFTKMHIADMKTVIEVDMSVDACDDKGSRRASR